MSVRAGGHGELVGQPEGMVAYIAAGRVIESVREHVMTEGILDAFQGSTPVQLTRNMLRQAGVDYLLRHSLDSVLIHLTFSRCWAEGSNPAHSLQLRLGLEFGEEEARDMLDEYYRAWKENPCQ